MVGSGEASCEAIVGGRMRGANGGCCQQCMYQPFHITKHTWYGCTHAGNSLRLWVAWGPGRAVEFGEVHSVAQDGVGGILSKLHAGLLMRVLHIVGYK